jgi:hypothetical protein
MKKQLILALTLVLAAFTQSEAAIRDTISGTVDQSTLTNTLVDGDTIYIGLDDTLQVTSNSNIWSSTDLVVIIDSAGAIWWTGNYNFTVGSNSTIIIESGGDLFYGDSSNCNQNMKLKLGGTNLASCSGGGNAQYSFDELINNGGSDPPPVPVELMYFGHHVISTDLSGSVVELNWQTASELNNDRFEVYRSVNGQDFDLVQVVPGAGTSSNINTYSILDQDAHNAKTLYYKLVQIDFDGTSETFNVLKVNLSNVEGQVSIYPNPAQKMVQFKITNSTDESTEITITNLNGEVVLTETANNSARLDVSELKSGVYFLRATSNNSEVVNRKLIIN